MSMSLPYPTRGITSAGPLLCSPGSQTGPVHIERSPAETLLTHCLVVRLLHHALSFQHGHVASELLFS